MKKRNKTQRDEVFMTGPVGEFIECDRGFVVSLYIYRASSSHGSSEKNESNIFLYMCIYR